MSFRNRIVSSGMVNPAELQANPKNWRVHGQGQADALAGVLEEVGWVQECIVNQRTGLLVDGHLRLQLALKRGEQSIPVKYVDLSEAEEALVLATIDPLSAMATADAAQLDALLREVSTGSAAVQEMLAELASDAAESAIRAMAVSPAELESEPDQVAGSGDSGYKQFSVPVTVDQERVIRQAVKAAKAAHKTETSGAALSFIAKEWLDAKHT